MNPQSNGAMTSAASDGEAQSDEQRPAASISTKENPSHARDDKDLLEKEWIERTKKVIASTRNDPYKLSEELNVLKADYMKKRYNKTIKIEK